MPRVGLMPLVKRRPTLLRSAGVESGDTLDGGLRALHQDDKSIAEPIPADIDGRRHGPRADGYELARRLVAPLAAESNPRSQSATAEFVRDLLAMLDVGL